MGGYIKGTSAASEIKVLTAAFHRASVAIEAAYDPAQAFRDASDLGIIARQISVSAADFRAYLAARLYDENEISLARLGDLLGVSKARAAQLVN